jgi:hypothetical protein
MPPLHGPVGAEQRDLGEVPETLVAAVVEADVARELAVHHEREDEQ